MRTLTIGKIPFLFNVTEYTNSKHVDIMNSYILSNFTGKFFSRREVSSHIVNEFDASVGFQPRVAQSYNHVKGNRPVKYEEIECVINGDYSVEGRKEGNEVYMPFSFIQNYFEVTV